MNFLDQLSKEDRELLVSLPYRVGLFVSQSDDSGGESSDEAEMQALDNIITGYSQEVFGAETVQYVVSETVGRKAEWGKWGKDLSNIEDECHKAIDILSRAVDEKEVSAYKHYLIEIGESVALAFREYGENTSFMDKLKVYFLYKREKMRASKLGIQYKQWEEFINISLRERQALRFIANALNTLYI